MISIIISWIQTLSFGKRIWRHFAFLYHSFFKELKYVNCRIAYHFQIKYLFNFQIEDWRKRFQVFINYLLIFDAFCSCNLQWEKTYERNIMKNALMTPNLLRFNSYSLFFWELQKIILSKDNENTHTVSITKLCITLIRHFIF